MTTLRLRLLGRQDCPLCEEMVGAVSLAAGPTPEIEHVDVDTDPVLQRRYGLRVPILIDPWGEVVCEGRFDAAAYSSWCSEMSRRRNA